MVGANNVASIGRSDFVNRCATLFVALWLFALSTSVSAADVDDHTLVMGVFPLRNLTETVALYSPLAEHLARQLKRPVRLESTRDLNTFWRNLSEKRYDIVHCNQYHYVKAHKLLGYSAILRNEEFGRSTLTSTILARNDRDIRSLQDLRGKTILFGGGRDAMLSYIIPTFLLRKAGLKPGDYVEKFALNPPNAILAISVAQVDAIGVGSNILRQAGANTHDVAPVAVSPPYAHLPWAVAADMPPALRVQIQNALTGLRSQPKGREILTQLKLTGFVTASDADYDPHRQIIYKVLGERY